MTTLRITGLDKLQKKIASLTEYVDTGVISDLEEWGKETVNIAKKNHKYKDDSNDLTNSLSVESNTLSRIVRLYIDPAKLSESGFNYGIAQHSGTKHMKGDPFLFRAVKRNRKNMLDTITKGIRKSLR